MRTGVRLATRLIILLLSCLITIIVEYSQATIAFWGPYVLYVLTVDYTFNTTAQIQLNLTAHKQLNLTAQRQLNLTAHRQLNLTAEIKHNPTAHSQTNLTT